MTRGTFAQWAIAIVQHDLRNRPEQEFAGKVETDQSRHNDWCDARADQFRESTVSGCEGEYFGGRSNEAACEPDSLGLVAIQQGIRCTPCQHGLQIPGQVYGVSDSGVHSLSAGRAVTVSCVTQYEGPSLAELLGDPVVDPVCGDPVDFSNLNFQMLYGAVADIREAQALRTVGPLVANCSDETRAPPPGKREYCEKVGFVEIDVQLAVEGRAARLDIGDIEDLSVGSPWIPSSHGFPHE